MIVNCDRGPEASKGEGGSAANSSAKHANRECQYQTNRVWAYVQPVMSASLPFSISVGIVKVKRNSYSHNLTDSICQNLGVVTLI